MANDGIIKRSEVPLCAFIILLLTHCYSVFAILDRRVYVDEDLRKNYKIEDFLWSGSGDGENETELPTTEEQTTWERTTTVFHTTTIISTSTVFYNSLSTVIADSGTGSDGINCSNGRASCSITPTPTISSIPNTESISPWPPPTDYPGFSTDAITDQRYWLITVLKVNGTHANFVPSELEDHLAKLYKIAFHRHQERHLGLRMVTSANNKAWNKATLRSQYLESPPRTRRDHRDTVTVHIHNVSNNDALNILYSVRISGLPVLATTAARDMKLVSDAEVVAELGYPVLTKAEPYLKSPPTIREDGSADKEYIVVLVSSVCATAVVSILIFIILLTLKKRLKQRIRSSEKSSKKGRRIVVAARNRTMNDRDGIDNAAFAPENAGNATGERSQTCRKKTKTTADSSRAADANGKADSQCYSRLPSDRPSSPNSFLSMPSVRNFPTTPLPEPLTNLLNTSSPPSSRSKTVEDARMVLSRHSSLGGEDPGVVGPMVWHVHRHRMKKAGTGTSPPADRYECSSADSDVDVGQMRKRLNQLLDDALSPYGSRRSSNDYADMDGKIHIKTSEEDDDDVSRDRSEIHSVRRHSQSAVTRKVFDVSEVHVRPRISITTEPRRSPAAPKARSAWPSTDGTASTSGRLHSRPMSAGPFHRPLVRPEFILTDAQLSPNDPIAPIISVIKEEVNKIP